jgi:hypothetical protein
MNLSDVMVNQVVPSKHFIFLQILQKPFMSQLQNTKQLSPDLRKERFFKGSVMRSRFGVLTTILLKSQVFCDVKPRRLVNSHGRFEGA